MGVNTNPRYIEHPEVLGMVQISTANTNRDGTGSMETLVDVTNEDGARVEKLRLKATGTVTAGKIHVYLHDGTNTRVEWEVLVTAVAPDSVTLAWESTLTLDIDMQKDWQIRVATDNAETFNVSAHGGRYG